MTSGAEIEPDLCFQVLRARKAYFLFFFGLALM